MQISLRALIIGAGLGIFFAIVSFLERCDTACSWLRLTGSKHSYKGHVVSYRWSLLHTLRLEYVCAGAAEAWTTGWSVPGTTIPC